MQLLQPWCVHLKVMEHPTSDCCVLYGDRVTCISLHIVTAYSLNTNWCLVLQGFWGFFCANESKGDLEIREFFAFLDGCMLTIVLHV